MALPDGIRPIQPTIPRVEKQRDRKPKRPFPELPQDGEPPTSGDLDDEEPTTGAHTPPPDDDTGHKVDIRV